MEQKEKQSLSFLLKSIISRIPTEAHYHLRHIAACENGLHAQALYGYMELN